MAKANASVTDADDYTQFNDQQLVAHWHKTQGIANTWKLKEAALREECVRRIFSNDTAAGTYNIELGQGYKLKCVRKDTYTPITKKTNPDDVTISEALQKIRGLGNEGAFIADRLVKWKPELSLTEYKQSPENIQKIILDAIVIKPAMPTLEVVEPKKK